MLELFLKIFFSPEEIIGMLIEITTIIAMCLVFIELKEKWWKSLIPIYSTYLLYKNTWKYKWFFIIEFVFLFAKSKSFSMIKKEIIGNVYDVIIALINKQEIAMDINVTLIIICFLGMIIFGICVFIMKRITYYKIAKSFNYNIFKTICVLISPIFFFFFILWKKWKNKKQKAQTY